MLALFGFTAMPLTRRYLDSPLSENIFGFYGISGLEPPSKINGNREYALIGALVWLAYAASVFVVARNSFLRKFIICFLFDLGIALMSFAAFCIACDIFGVWGKIMLRSVALPGGLTTFAVNNVIFWVWISCGVLFCMIVRRAFFLNITNIIAGWTMCMLTVAVVATAAFLFWESNWFRLRLGEPLSVLVICFGCYSALFYELLTLSLLLLFQPASARPGFDVIVPIIENETGTMAPGRG